MFANPDVRDALAHLHSIMSIIRNSHPAALRATIGKVTGLSISAIIECARIAILILPLYLSIPQVARAGEIYETDTAENFGTAPALARFGPFAVIDRDTVELSGETDSDSPAQFRALLAQYPNVRTVRMVECAGTVDDDANLSIARMIRAKGLNTHVPAGGSVRSGGVELFIAGVKRTADQGAEFGVHSWQDDEGNEASDVPADDPIHANYITYYKDMGLAPQVAREFYAFTNTAATFDNVHYMTAGELARYQIVN